jgi:hypothetical protein
MTTLGWCKGGRIVKGEMNSGESAGIKWGSSDRVATNLI